MADYVVDDLADIDSITGATGGQTAWVKNALTLFVLSESQGDWVSVGQGGRQAVGTVSSGAGLAHQAHRVLDITFPADAFTQPPVLVASAGSARYTLSIHSVTKTGAKIIVANWSGAAEQTPNSLVHWNATQIYS